MSKSTCAAVGCDATRHCKSACAHKNAKRMINSRILKWGAVLCGLAAIIAGALTIDFVTRSQIEGARRGDCVMHLKQMSLALLNYHDKYGSFPPAVVKDSNGKPAHSWRVLILPFLGGEDLYQKYDFSEPWNGPNNSRLQSELPPHSSSRYQCPSSGVRGTMTNYVAIIGPSTIWPENHPGTIMDDDMKEAQPEVLVVEVPGYEVNWMEPKDLSIDAAVSLLVEAHGDRGPIHPRGVHFADTAQNVRLFPKTTDRLLLKKLLSRTYRDAGVTRSSP